MSSCGLDRGFPCLGDWHHYKYDPDRSSFKTLHKFVGQENGLMGALDMFTHRSEHPVILLVDITVHIVGNVTLSRKIEKMYDFLG